jgi:hypothetical protein
VARWSKTKNCLWRASLMHPQAINNHLISVQAVASCTMILGGRLGICIHKHAYTYQIHIREEAKYLLQYHTYLIHSYSCRYMSIPTYTCSPNNTYMIHAHTCNTCSYLHGTYLQIVVLTLNFFVGINRYFVGIL